MPTLPSTIDTTHAITVVVTVEIRQVPFFSGPSGDDDRGDHDRNKGDDDHRDKDDNRQPRQGEREDDDQGEDED